MEMKNRKPNRLRDFDYGQEGCYFVTLCTQNRARLFEMQSAITPNDFQRHGTQAVPYDTIQNQIIHKWIRKTQEKFDNLTIDQYVIMPDHLHLMVNIREQRTGISLSDVMRYFKTMTTNDYICCVKEGTLPPFNKKLWQKSYYDHVIRNQKDYNEIWEYIENNPAKWMITHNP